MAFSEKLDQGCGGGGGFPGEGEAGFAKVYDPHLLKNTLVFSKIFMDFYGLIFFKLHC